ncbi:SixA phosphatase family protein [Pararhizobium sp. O133]|uniref:SixA phosphatase family protein n=1 Tax=Pararhizobium sp. O133 TaxID=3449278 RepID=UPI003F686607
MSAAPAPVFRLYLLRHARAGWALPGQTDFDRPLDDTGFAAAEIVADLASDRGFKPDLVLCSTAVRCRQTAEAFRRSVREDLDIRHVDALYAGAADVYRDIIAGQDASVSSLMVVGHNPVIEEILRESIGEQSASEVIPVGYPPGALAAIDFEARPRPDALPHGRLVALIMPDGHME